ncbi:MAG: ABC transporter ATP-binding protein [Ignisphaera sp.]|nr:ABC transporter ATP-binding protein [Ignisphaera sp.]MDW8084758.1 ABC transporter ATP-binding protein [Ignisphaera sp.]
MAFLKLEGISKKYNDRFALDNITLSVEKGEILSIAGPPGSGKTTLLKIIAGLVKPTSGRVYVEGTDITETPPYLRGFSMVFETPPVYPDRTGYENIAFPLRLRKLPEDEVRKRVYEVAELLAIKHILSRKPSTYSGGEYQRVALARALVTSPKLLLLDEPFRNLDAKIREHMVVWFKQLQAKLGITIVYATHDPLEAFTIGNRAAILLNGRVKQYGLPANILRNPLSHDVDEFISIPALNTFKVRFRSMDDEVLIQLNSITIRKRAKLNTENGEGEAIATVRPMDISVSRSPGEGTVAGRVELIQYLGANILATVRVGDLSIRVVVPKDAVIREGEDIYLSLDPARIRLYETSSGRRLDVVV